MKVATIASAVATSMRPVEPHDAAEGGQRVGFARAHVGFGDRVARRGAAGVGVLDDDGRGLGELGGDPRGGVEIEQVGVRELLALQHGRAAKPLVRSRVPRAGWCGFSP